MALLEVLKYGDPMLRKIVVPISENKIDPELIKNMFETFSLMSYERLKLLNLETFYVVFLTQKSVTFKDFQN